MIEIEVPGNPPILLNWRAHWRTKLKLKNIWYNSVQWELARKKLIPDQPIATALVHYTRYAPGVQPDQTNLASSFKWPEDALVRARVLIDDKPANVQNFYHWKRCTRAEKRIKIQVAPVDW